ncbi:hypothetical protein FANTH_3302 [Fusarium anthophilum]|uniref:Uncharacterized protein n=1 Tax=Fusarium anthophilum TaxID=48485 RepID=A0A8H5E9F6_9HYPO|nr:hypothetical protein FANTH_3302 [Fusarium anthophilum]
MGSSLKSQRQDREAVHYNEGPLPPSATNATQGTGNEEPQSDLSPTEMTGTFSEDREESHESSEDMEGVVLCQESTQSMARELTTAQMSERDPANELESLFSNIESIQNQLEETRLELANSCAERKELVEALNDLRTRVQPAGRLTDREVTGFVKQLKYSISNLAEQWPETVPPKSPSMHHKYLRHLQSITPESSDYRRLLQNEDRRPQLVESFIWKVLTTEVFGLFHWAGESVAPHIRGLQLFLTADLGSPRPSDVQMWTSKTTQLFSEALNSRGGDEKEQNKLYLERIRNQINSLIIETLGLSVNSNDSVAEQLDDILQGAIDLDKRFCQQAARWEWKYLYKSHHEEGLVFDGDCMVLDQAERFCSDKKTETQAVVKFVISPALVKRGDSDGVNEGLETIVIKMGVSCQDT